MPYVLPSLLILSCSERKSASPGLLAAIDRYDGPPFRVLRRYLSEHRENSLVIYVLSAKFGLIGSDTPIPAYDQRLDFPACVRLRPQVTGALAKLFQDHTFGEVLLVGGGYYRWLLTNSLPNAVPLPRIMATPPGLGAPLACLHDWLRERNSRNHPPRPLAGCLRCP